MRRALTVRTGFVSVRIDRRMLVLAAVMLTVIVALALWAVTLGSFPISVGQVADTLLGGGGKAARKVVWEWRGPRIAAAILFGALLGMSGAVFQSLTRNPLGSPDVIGFNAGSYTGVVVAMMLGASGYAATVSAAVVGGLIAAVIVYALAFRDGVSGTRLILVGIAISLFFGGLNQWFAVTADVDEALRAAVWGAGSLAKVTPAAVAVAAAIALAALVIMPVAQRWMSMLELGDDTAAMLGLRLERTKALLVVFGILTTAVVTATAGPIAFVALAAPQIGRRLRGRGASVDLLSAALTGALILLAADIVAQHALPGILLPVGAVTVCAGGAYLLWLLAVEGRRR